MRACTRHPSPPYPLTIPASYPLTSHSTPSQFFHFPLKHSTSHPLPPHPTPHPHRADTPPSPKHPFPPLSKMVDLSKRTQKDTQGKPSRFGFGFGVQFHSRFGFPFSLPFAFTFILSRARKSAREEGRQSPRTYNTHACNIAMDGSYPGHRDGQADGVRRQAGPQLQRRRSKVE